MILVTGTSGFIGKHLLVKLIETYGKDNILALTSTPINQCPFLIHNNYQFENDFFIKTGFKKINTIIHAGAFIPKNGNQANDINNCNRNIINTEKLLNSDFPYLKEIIFLSTVDIYGVDDILSEESMINPISLYGHSKLYCEKMIDAFAEKNNLTHQILRIGHVYGPGEESYQKIIPVTMKKILNNEELEIWGSGLEIRSFIYIKDVVAAIVKSIGLNEYVKPINVVSNQQINIKYLVAKIQKIANHNGIVKIIPNASKGRNLIFDNSKMTKYLLSNEKKIDDGLFEEWEYMKSIII
jgi:UDP-glucose 4-epimerase